MKVSICIPYYDKMDNAEFFMNRCLDSIKKQTYTDYEVVITKEGTMAQNSNSAIKAARGDIIKILYQDDYFESEHALQTIVDAFRGGWLATGCLHDYNGSLINPHMPEWTDDIEKGNNKIGSPSVIAFENKEPLLFDETLGWLLDCDLYKRLYERYGEPTYVYEYCSVIGIHPGQATNVISNNEKLKEQQYLNSKYETNPLEPSHDGRTN